MKPNSIVLLKERLDSLEPLNSQAMDQVLYDFIIRNTYNSCAMDGNRLTFQE